MGLIQAVGCSQNCFRRYPLRVDFLSCPRLVSFSFPGRAYFSEHDDLSFCRKWPERFGSFRTHPGIRPPASGHIHSLDRKNPLVHFSLLLKNRILLTLLNLFKGRVFQMKELSARIPEEHFHLILSHKPGNHTLAKSRMVHPVTP